VAAAVVPVVPRVTWPAQTVVQAAPGAVAAAVAAPEPERATVATVERAATVAWW
jgi:hypothetical protein